MLEALKLYFNQSGCIFVLGIDRQPIESAIAYEYKNLDIAKESYLDKIVQLPFTIPALNQFPVENYVKKHLPEDLSGCQELLILGAPDNPRQLKRTINTLLLLNSIAKTSFPNRDTRILCALALIQNSAPNLYQYLRQKPGDWALVVPPGTDSQPSGRPDWLKVMLSGTDAREALSNALVVLAGLLAKSSTDIVEFRPYIELGEQVTSRTPSVESPKAPGRGDRQTASRIDEAVPLYERAVEERKHNLGDDDSDTLAAEIALATANQAAGRTEEAIALYQGVLPRMQRVLGADHPDVLAAESSLATAYQAAGRTEEAIALYREVLANMQRVLGADHPNVLAAESSLATAYQAAGRTEEAIALYREVLPNMQRVLGADHPNVLAAESSLATAYQAAGRTEEAIALYREVLPNMQRVLGADHPNVLAAESSLATAYQAAGRTEEAIALYREVLPNMQRVLGADDPVTQGTKMRLDSLVRPTRRERPPYEGGEGEDGI